MISHLLMTFQNSWIPARFVPLILEDINVNPEECIEWFERWFPEEHSRIGEMGLIG